MMVEPNGILPAMTSSANVRIWPAHESSLACRIRSIGSIGIDPAGGPLFDWFEATKGGKIRGGGSVRDLRPVAGFAGSQATPFAPMEACTKSTLNGPRPLISSDDFPSAKLPPFWRIDDGSEFGFPHPCLTIARRWRTNNSCPESRLCAEPTKDWFA